MCPRGQAGADRQGDLRQLRRGLRPGWSPDSKWIAYHRDLDNQLNAIFLYSLETHKSTQVTDGMSDASSPAFDLNGKYLYFIASTDDGPSRAGIDLSSLDRAQTSAPYVVVLAKDGASPVPPESDDEKIKDERRRTTQEDERRRRRTRTDQERRRRNAEREGQGRPAKTTRTRNDKPVEVKVDLEEIGDRILSLPIPPRNYGGIAVGKAGVIYPARGSARSAGPPTRMAAPAFAPSGVLRLKSASLKRC